MTYHDFQPQQGIPKGISDLRWNRCAKCGKSRMSAFHFMPDSVDTNLSKRIRELPKEAWRIGGHPLDK